MGKAVSKILTPIGSIKPTRIIMLGLDGAGKTNILYKLRLNKFIKTIPTIGFHAEDVSHKNRNLVIWDIGGQKSIRGLWKNYYSNTDAIIFVVDSCAVERLNEAKEELLKMLDDGELKYLPVLIYANKQDIAEITTEEIANKLELSGLSERPWKVQGACASSGKGLYEGLDWIDEELSKNRR